MASTLTVDERLYRLEQAFERGLNVNLAQFDPDPAVAVPALTPAPDPVPDPEAVAAQVAAQTAHDDAVAAAVAAVAAAPTVDDPSSHVATALADVESALKDSPDSVALADAKAQLENLAADLAVPPAENAPPGAAA